MKLLHEHDPSWTRRDTTRSTQNFLCSICTRNIMKRMDTKTLTVTRNT